MPLSPSRARPLYRAVWLAVALLGILALRRPDAFFRPQFWAEDFGFLIAAEQQGWASLVTPQAGYLHTLPRLIALAATLLDPARQPAFYLIAALGITVSVCSSFFSPRLELPNKPLLALVVVAVPTTGEVFFTPTNLQWIVALGILGTALKRDPRNASDWGVDLGLLIAGGLTGPMILFAMPVLLVRVWRHRSRASVILCLIAAAAAALQLWFALQLAPESAEPFSVRGLGSSIAFHLFASPVLGALATPALPKIAAVLVAASVTAFVGVVIATSTRERAVLLSMLAFALLVLAAASLQKRLDAWDYADLRHGDRYFYIPKTILFWILSIGAVVSSWIWVRRGAVALLALALVANAPRFRLAPHPDWGWYEACTRIRAGEGLVVTIDPGWKFYYRRGAPDSRFLPRRESESLERK